MNIFLDVHKSHISAAVLEPIVQHLRVAGLDPWYRSRCHQNIPQ